MSVNLIIHYVTGKMLTKNTKNSSNVLFSYLYFNISSLENKIGKTAPTINLLR